MNATAIVLHAPERLEVSTVTLNVPGAADIVVDVAFSGISTGTERLLWSGRMPPFPGMGYPLVPGYESVGTVTHVGIEAAATSGLREGQTVFVPGASSFSDVRSLFGGAASRLVTKASRVAVVDEALGDRGTLLALAATAHHAIAGATPDLIVGHGVLGRLIARLAVIAGGNPVVWETNPARQAGGLGYDVVHPDDDTRRDYKTLCDVSGDPNLLDALIARCARGAEIILAGFYADRLSFSFPPAFMRETRFRIAAEWQESDLKQTAALIAGGALSLDGLITHHATPAQADAAYRTAFTDVSCLKMILDWRS
jgi:3-hydroxyethyl bacteriochlorophyllide a dehydrogenase